MPRLPSDILTRHCLLTPCATAQYKHELRLEHQISYRRYSGCANTCSNVLRIAPSRFQILWDPRVYVSIRVL
jgi:hypothetical protein